jgi:hypothetical protein
MIFSFFSFSLLAPTFVYTKQIFMAVHKTDGDEIKLSRIGETEKAHAISCMKNPNNTAKKTFFQTADN